MKKNCLIVLLLVLVFSLTSCNKPKEVKYRICGFYLECVDVETRSINDKNPKVYFDISDNNAFTTKSGNTGYNVVFLDSIKKVETDSENIKQMIFTTSIRFLKDTIETVKIRLITLEDGQYKISDNVLKTLKVSNNSFEYSNQYIYQKQQYHFQGKLIIKVKE